MGVDWWAPRARERERERDEEALPCNQCWNVPPVKYTSIKAYLDEGTFIFLINAYIYTHASSPSLYASFLLLIRKASSRRLI